MRLWTIQPYCVYEVLEKKRIYRCDSSLSTLLEENNFVNAYNWISKQMRKRIGNQPNQVTYPVWAWHTVEGKHQRPDMRKQYLKVYEKSVLLEIEIPDNEVLLTDFDMWHIVLNDAINYKANYMSSLSDDEWYSEANKEDLYFYSLSDKEKLLYKEKSWEKIICSSDSSLPKYVQATFWELRKENVKKSWILKK